MGVGHHAATRMYSADLAARLGVATEHATMVRDALTHDARRNPSDATTVETALRRSSPAASGTELDGVYERSERPLRTTATAGGDPAPITP